MAIPGMLFTLPNLTNDEAAGLAVRAQAGDGAALDRLVMSHTRLAKHMAFSFRPLPGLDHEDLFQEAMLALHTSVARYDPSYRVPFSTYAAMMIRFGLWRRLKRERRYLDTRADFVECRDVGVPSFADDPVRELLHLCAEAEQRGEITADHVDVFVRRLQGVPDKQVCAELGIHRNTLGRRLTRTLIAIREALDADGC
jgi:RNA polymerase sigma factor (sigma-70 family)